MGCCAVLKPSAPGSSDAGQPQRSPKPFSDFVDLAVKAAQTPDLQNPVSEAHPLLNGVPYSAFRRDVILKARREMGAFFSSSKIAGALADKVEASAGLGAVVLDPTCGIGDLLLAFASRLPMMATLSETVAAWGAQLAGIDKEDHLVRLAKVRLCMLARARGGFVEDADPLQMFPLIRTGDMFGGGVADLLDAADAVLFNPPFGKTTWETPVDWASGQINAAAMFLDRLTCRLRKDVPIAAVLPEVLRCGSRYQHFRDLLARRGYRGGFEIYGRFDTWTDVDVFTTLLTRGEDATELWSEANEAIAGRVSDAFEIRVGAVVPHRDPKSGPDRAYICAKTTPAWDNNFVPFARRQFEGTAFSPPFVAIRRTSSPSDRYRAVATVIAGDEPIAVENHLLVAKPLDGRLATCEALATHLRSNDINARLNGIMRCRHLTTGVIKALPWAEQDE
jgi:hypothetical protein